MPLRATSRPVHRLRSLVIAGLAVATLGTAAVATPIVASSLVPSSGASVLDAADVAPTGSLGQAVDDPARRGVVIDELSEAISQTAETQGGPVLRGLNSIERSAPGAVGTLLDRQAVSYANALQPYWDAYRASGAQGGFGAYLSERAPDVSDALLAVGDRFAAEANSTSVRFLYRVARFEGPQDVTAALPQIGAIMEKAVG